MSPLRQESLSFHLLKKPFNLWLKSIVTFQLLRLHLEQEVLCGQPDPLTRKIGTGLESGADWLAIESPGKLAGVQRGPGSTPSCTGFCWPAPRLPGPRTTGVGGWTFPWNTRGRPLCSLPGVPGKGVPPEPLISQKNFWNWKDAQTFFLGWMQPS